ncbi:hypothetical protein LBMAG53_15740 [Planctomycetota bacterium]|nr:hypothetical protein LBMAG53_15740 [Planctomycetota bacterium]
MTKCIPRPRTLPLASAVLALFCAQLTCDEIHLADGRVVEGELARAADGGWDLRQTQGSMSVVMRLKASDVVLVVPGPTANQKALTEVRSLRAKLADLGSAEDWWNLVQRARAAGDLTLGRELASQVLDRDRRHDGARRFLGYTLESGVWMRPHEAAAARGEVFHNGRWMAWSEREDLIAAETARRAAVVAEAERLAKERAERSEPVEQPTSVIWIQPYQSPLFPSCRHGSWPGWTTNGPILHVQANGQSPGWAWNINWKW